MSELPEVPVTDPVAFLDRLLWTAERDEEFAHVLCEKVALFARGSAELSHLVRETAKHPKGRWKFPDDFKPEPIESPDNLPFWTVAGQRHHLLWMYAKFVQEDQDQDRVIDQLCDYYKQTFDQPIEFEHMSGRISEAITELDREGRLDRFPTEVRQIIAARQGRRKSLS